VTPADATNKAVTWTSSNNAVATVSASGTVTAKTAGSAAITVTTVDGGFTDTCAVTVTGYLVNSEESWNNALSSISGAQDGSAGNPNVFVIDITGSFHVRGRDSTNITGSYKEVHLTGDGTISLSSNGSLIRTAANQNFIIDGPTLQGRNGNTTSLVYIAGNSAVELQTGKISGNRHNNADGGGVYIDHGNFTMSGGEISGNTIGSNGDGGGVYSNYGNFTMSGGEISLNDAPTYGGGVYINNGNFTMSGGAIYGGDSPLGNTSNYGSAAYIEMYGPINNTIYKYP
jgi:hypothetical protein